MNAYHLKVSIIGRSKLYRTLEVSENHTFEALHYAIFQAFDRYEQHMDSFFITKKEAKSLPKRLQAPEITHPVNLEQAPAFVVKDMKSATETKIGDAGLNEKDIFYYWFDFGDDWWHRIRVEKIMEKTSDDKIIGVVKSVGNAPPQHPEFDEEFDDDEDF